MLRNNQQTGPHSLEELLQLDLKPFDLIWVEGKSYGWSYPTEIETLKPFVTAAPPQRTNTSAAGKPASDKKIFVSLPVANLQHSVPPPSPVPDPIEQKAEELRRRIQSYAPQNPVQQEEIKTNYARGLSEVEEDYTSWVYRKRTKRKNHVKNKYRVAAGIIAVGLAGAWLMAKTVYKESAVRPTPVVVEGSRTAITAPSSEKQGSSSATVIQNEAVRDRPLKQSSGTSSTAKKTKKNQPPLKVKAVETVKASTEEPVQKELRVQPAENTPPVAAGKDGTVMAEAPKEKKKSLKQILGGLFKKNKKEEAATEEPQPADNSNNERKATRREESSAQTLTVDLAGEVDIKINKSSDDWMMGVQGLKLTLYNRSTATLKTAAVEVLYYSEQDDLLDKKTVYFSNIASKKSQTVAAPDHRMADHVNYRIISATGVENAYARQ